MQKVAARVAIEARKAELRELDKGVLARFAETEAHLVKRALPEGILARHRVAVSKYRQEMAALLSNLDGIESAPDEAALCERAGKALGHLKRHRNKRSHNVLDPSERLSFSRL